ncbi:MAG: hypothetical protein HY719_16650, partial [Planctomycetes bacterium]|nr:hypothetical protein [Planctomycetota bacterium]
DPARPVAAKADPSPPATTDAVTPAAVSPPAVPSDPGLVAAIDQAGRQARKAAHVTFDRAGRRLMETTSEYEEGRRAVDRVWRAESPGEEEWVEYTGDGKGRVVSAVRYYLGEPLERRAFVYLPDGRVKIDHLMDGTGLTRRYQRVFYRTPAAGEVYDDRGQITGRRTFDAQGNLVARTTLADPACHEPAREETFTWQAAPPGAAAAPEPVLEEIGYRLDRLGGRLFVCTSEEAREGGAVARSRRITLEGAFPRGEEATISGAVEKFEWSFQVVGGRVMSATKRDQGGAAREAWKITYAGG